MDYVGLLNTVGFPVAITLWFMYRLESTIVRHTDAINLLALAVETCPAKKKINN